MLSKLTWKGASERVRAPYVTPLVWACIAFGESDCLGMQPKVGGKLHLKAKHCFEKRVKKTAKPLGGKRMQLNWLCSSSGTMLIGDASLQKPIGFALGIAVNSSALLCKAGQQQVPVAEKGGWEGSHSSE